MRIARFSEFTPVKPACLLHNLAGYNEDSPQRYACLQVQTPTGARSLELCYVGNINPFRARDLSLALGEFRNLYRSDSV